LSTHAFSFRLDQSREAFVFETLTDLLGSLGLEVNQSRALVTEPQALFTGGLNSFSCKNSPTSDLLKEILESLPHITQNLTGTVTSSLVDRVDLHDNTGFPEHR